NYHDSRTSFLEAVFAKGDRRLGRGILQAYRDGAMFDSWEEGFSYERWITALQNAGVDADFYALRERAWDEVQPWDVVDYGVSKRFLKREYDLAVQGKTTPNCRERCSGCGINGFTGRECFANC
ncbi:MAG: B12-binding domain-containing radical SAM protein, partial [Oscillospiraceae bacterium]|nr:B12-binding domain-containing radical SAM protein [Oscillospiraceae bacterium]